MLYKKPGFYLTLPIADILFNLEFNNKASLMYFKKRLLTTPKSTHSETNLKIVDSSKEYIFILPPENLIFKIPKRNDSQDDIFFILQALIQYSVLKFDILLIHSSSIIKQKKAYIFMAPSGSGKSTITSFVNSKQVLSDDVAIIKKTSDYFRVYTSAFDNKHFKTYPLKNARLDKILSIKKASFTTLSEIGTFDEMISLTLHNNLLFWFLELQKKKTPGIRYEEEPKLYNLILELINYAPVKTLYLKKDPNFLSII